MRDSVRHLWRGASDPARGDAPGVRWVGVVVALVVLAGCSFFDRYPDDELAAERVAAVEADPGFSFVPEGAELETEIKVAECPPEESDSEGLFTTRVYRTEDSSAASVTLVRRLRDEEWTVVERSSQPGVSQEITLQRDFGDWVAPLHVTAEAGGFLRVEAYLDEEGICSPPID
jgi:hypothetical protein